MAEDSGQEHDDRQSEMGSAREVAQPGIGHEELWVPGTAPANPGTLMAGDPRLNKRGNAPVRAAVMQRMQSTYGNRAVQRFLQRVAPPATSTALPVQRDGPGTKKKGTATVAHTPATGSYTVDGKTLEEAAEQIEAREEAGLTEWNPSYSAPLDDDGNVKSVSITVTTTVTMPTWSQKGTRGKPAQDEWARFYKALDQHEQGHVKLVKDKLNQALADSMLGKSEADAAALFQTALTELEAASKAYDKANDHGRNAGCTIDKSIDPKPVPKKPAPGTAPTTPEATLEGAPEAELVVKDAGAETGGTSVQTMRASSAPRALLPIQRGDPPTKTAGKSKGREHFEQAKERGLLSKLHLGKALEAGFLAEASVPEKLEMMKILLEGWTGSFDERDLKIIWNSFGNLIEAASTHYDLFKWSVEDGVEFPEVEALKTKFADTVIGLSKQYMQENKQFVNAEIKRLGLDKKDASPTIEQGREIAQTQEAARRIEEVQKAQTLMLDVTVGWVREQAYPLQGRRPDQPDPNDQRVWDSDPSGAAMVYRPVAFNPYQGKPNIVPAPAGKETPKGDYDRLFKEWNDLEKVTTILTNKYPSLYAMVRHGLGKGEGNKPVADEKTTPDQARDTMAKAMEELNQNIEKTEPKLGTDIKWHELQPIMAQLRKNPFWSQKVPSLAIDDALEGQNSRDFWVAAGLGTAAMAAFIVAPIAIAGGAVAVGVGATAVGVGLSVGQAAASWDKYTDMNLAQKSTVKDELGLINGDQVNTVLLTAMLDTVFALLDVYGAVAPGVKAGAKAAKGVAGKAGRTAIEAAQDAKDAARLAKKAEELAKLAPDPEMVSKAAKDADEAVKMAQKAEKEVKTAAEPNAKAAEEASAAVKEAESSATAAKEAEKAKPKKVEGDTGAAETTGDAAKTGAAQVAKLTPDAYQTQLNSFKQKLSEAGLDAAAIERVVAKKEIGQIKGQILEEVWAKDVKAQLGDEKARALLLGDKATEEVKFFEGHRITDSRGQQLGDGMLVIERGNGEIEIVNVFEAKAGDAAKQELRSVSDKLKDMSKTERAEAFRQAIIQLKKEKPELRKKYPFNKEFEDVVNEAYKNGTLEKEITDLADSTAIARQREPGQVQKTGDRLLPKEVADLETIKEIPATVLIDGELKKVTNGGRPKVTGVLPNDIKPGKLEKDIAGPLKPEQGKKAGQGLPFEIKQASVKETDLAAWSKELSDLKKAAPDAVPVPGAPTAAP